MPIQKQLLLRMRNKTTCQAKKREAIATIPTINQPSNFPSNITQKDKNKDKNEMENESNTMEMEEDNSLDESNKSIDDDEQSNRLICLRLSFNCTNWLQQTG
jgi:hypothetical protein